VGTKLHAAVDRRGRLVRLILTGGQAGDGPQAAALLADLAAGQVRWVIADRGYDSDANRRRIRRLRARCCVRPLGCRRVRKRFDRRRYRHRNVIERLFRRLKQCRRVATRYEKKAKNYEGFVWLAAFVTGSECP